MPWSETEEYDDGYTRESFERAEEDRPEDFDEQPEQPDLLHALELAYSHIGWLWDVVERNTTMRREGSEAIHKQVRAAIAAACNTGHVTKEAYEEYGRQYELEQIQSAQSDATQGDNA